jgi:hypothetical protein
MLLRALTAVNKHQPKNKRNPMKRICIEICAQLNLACDLFISKMTFDDFLKLKQQLYDTSDVQITKSCSASSEIHRQREPTENKVATPTEKSEDMTRERREIRESRATSWSKLNKSRASALFNAPLILDSKLCTEACAARAFSLKSLD